MDDLFAAEQEIESLKLELAKYQARDDAYKWKHIGLFEWDFTTGIVDEEVYVETPKGRMGMAQAAGVMLPCSIDDLTSAFADTCVDPAFAHWFRTNLSTEFVRGMYKEKGSFELAFERKLKPELEGYPYARYSAPIIKDPKTGHLMARGVITDVTNRYNLVAPIEYKDLDTARAALVTALKDVFLLVYYINVKKDTIEEFAAVDRIHGMTSMQQGALSARKTIAMMKSLYNDEMRHSFEEFADLDTLSQRMEGRSMLSTELCTANGMWALTSFVVVSRDEDGSVSDIIVTAQDVTANHDRELGLQEARDEAETRLEEVATLNGELEERQAQLEEATAEQELQIDEISALNSELEGQRATLEERLHIIRSLANRFFAVYYVDIAADEYTEISSIGNIQKHYKAQGHAQAALTSMVPMLMHPEFKESMQAFVDLSFVAVKLKDAESITQRYIGNTTGWSEASFIACDRDEEGVPTSVIFCTREVNDEVRADMEHSQELEAARDAANAANDAKTSFLFSMSHDIRTPMNAIVGYTNLLKKDSSDAEKRASYLDKISNASDFLLGLINDVLEMARIDSGKMALDETTCSLREVNDALLSVFEGEMDKKDISYTRSVNIEHEYVLCDDVKLREVFLNILSNALKYTPKGGSVNVELRELPTQLDGYALYQTKISDSGIGMATDFVPHLFEEFSRERTSTESRVQGTGLGMPIVKKLVDMMGGTIEVASELGRGTTFTVTLHHRISSEEALRKAEASADAQASLVGKCILLAEDNDLNAEIAMEILGETGAEIERAEDGIICVDMLEKAPGGYFDLILMDIQMPNMDGYKATQVIRRIPDEMKANIPIIAMTANAFEEDKRAALEAGMDAHVAKPIDVPKLMSTIAIVLSGESRASTFGAHEAAKGEPEAHEGKVLLKLQQSFASMVVPGGFFAYWAAQPERLIYANEMACKIWGCKDYQELCEFAGGSFKGLIHPDDYERAEQEIWDCINGSEDDLDQTKYRIIKKNGTVSRVDDYGRLVRDPDNGDIFYVFVSEVADAASGGEPR